MGSPGSNEFVYNKRDLVVAGIAVTITVVLLGLGFGLANGASVGVTTDTPKEVPLTAYDAALQILDEFPVIDGHNDMPLTIRDYYSNDLERFDLWSETDLNIEGCDMCHTDLPRLIKGKVGGQFWSAYMGCSTQYKDATALFIEQVDVIKRLAAKYSDDLTFVTTADGIEQAFKEKKIASLIGVESGHAISSSLGVLRMIYDLGARYMTLTHSCNTPWADTSESEDGNEPVNSDGLSDFGRSVVREMNRLGMLVDLSHVSASTMRDALEVARAPVIFSHSSARTVNNVSRNVPDDVLEKVRINRGIVMVNFYDCFVIPDCTNNRATVDDVVKHVNYIRNVAGVDHVGLGGDYNGVGQTPIGLEDVSGYPNLFAALLDNKEVHWTKEDLGKLASNNIIRVLREVEGVRDALKNEQPVQEMIPVSDLNEDSSRCMSNAGLQRV